MYSIVHNELTVDGEEGGLAGPVAGKVGGHTAVVGGVLQPGLLDQQVACTISQSIKNSNQR